ncbi:MAG: N-acetylglucosaminyl-diphospho-decaprenol L-rhamnosyltransferase [Anaerolineae bacterium]|nr:N-acetylglucosaminyl-diphospho-decaprenol L-rhamnosyltransferase [Anaerolineae bacterium]
MKSNTTGVPLVVVLVPNWNGRHHLEHCLPSLAASRYRNCRVIVLDNGSSDGSQSWLRDCFPQVELIELHSNLGFTGANNVGMATAMAAGADYITLLNNDTRVEPDWLDVLVDVAESDRAIGMCEAQQYTWDEKYRIKLTLRPDWLEGELSFQPPERPAAVTPTAYAAGCCVLIKTSALRQIGLFDPRYFAYVEDVDLSLRAWIAGYKVVSVPQAVIYHRVGASSESLLRMRLGYRNQLLTILKNYEWSTISTFRRSILERWFLTRNRIALRATLAVLQNLPVTLKMRQAVQQTRRWSDKEIFSLIAGPAS